MFNFGNVQTTNVNGMAPVRKPFTWSYSRLKNFNTCPKRYEAYDVNKSVVEEKGHALVYGDEVHAAMAKRIQKGEPLPPGIANMERHAQDFLKGVTPQSGVQILVERKYAVRADFTPCTYFDKSVWYRGVADAIKIVPSNAGEVALVVDWKTGGRPDDPRKVDEIKPQLYLTAAVVMANHPQVNACRTKFVWLDHAKETTIDIKRVDVPKIWAGILPNVAALKQAHDDNLFPAKPSGLCKNFCGVLNCPYYGVGA